MQRGSTHVIIPTILILVLGAIFTLSVTKNALGGRTYEKEANEIEESIIEATPEDIVQEPAFVVTHIKTPEPLKAMYMTSWVAATPSLRQKVLDLLESTEINSLVIDIKDSTGKVSFLLEDPVIADYGSSENRIKNIKEFIDDLHNRGIYVIGRISVFQDPYLTEKRPDLAVKRADNGGVWKDRKGLAFLDQSSQEVWDYIVHLAKESYAVGFDEINFDYVRFPSDGDINNIDYNLREGETRADVIERFFQYLHSELEETDMVTSADLFGMVTTNTDDLGIGQILEKALPYFDYIAPMVYPSHYPPGFNGYSNPNHYPYEIIKYAMDNAVSRTEAIGQPRSKIRPWLQDFDYGGNYGVEEVREQIQATYDAGLTSWMMWDPSNKYTPTAYKPI